MATTKIKYKGFGSYTGSVSLPYTATEDGFIYFYLNPSTTSGGRFLMSVGGRACGASTTNGDGVSTIMPIRPGETATKLVLQGGTLACGFFPLK